MQLFTVNFTLTLIHSLCGITRTYTEIMDLQTSHLAAALLSGSNTFNASSIVPESNITNNVTDLCNDKAVEQPKHEEPKMENVEEEKDEIGSLDEFSDEVIW